MTKFSLFYMYRPISHFIIMLTQYILLDSIYPVRGTVMDKTDHWRKGLQVLQSLTSLTAIFRNVCKLSDRNCLPILIFVNLYKISGWWGRSPSITSCMCVCVIAPRIRGRPAVRPSLTWIVYGVEAGVNTTSTPQADELCDPVSRGNPRRPESFASRTCMA